MAGKYQTRITTTLGEHDFNDTNEVSLSGVTCSSTNVQHKDGRIYFWVDSYSTMSGRKDGVRCEVCFIGQPDQVSTLASVLTGRRLNVTMHGRIEYGRSGKTVLVANIIDTEEGAFIYRNEQATLPGEVS